MNQQVVEQVRRAGSGRPILKQILIVFGVASGLVVLFGLALIYLAFQPVPQTYAIALGDLDGDGDLDAFYANGQNEGPQPNTILINQGGGRLVDSGQRLGNEESSRVVLGDLNGDGLLDAWVANVGYSTLYYNQGQGQFGPGTNLFGDSPMGSALWAVALGDLNRDGVLEAVGGGCCGALESALDYQKQHPPFSLVWTPQDAPAGRFRASQRLESLGAAGAALGDLNGDGDLDVFFANDSVMDLNGDLLVPQPDTVWFNDGQGRFSDSGQRLGAARATSVALGDLDGDGDLDAFVTNHGPNEVWLNDGKGAFRDSGQRLGPADAVNRQVFLADLDGDADLDAAVVAWNNSFIPGIHLKLWFNDGQGRFSEGRQRIAPALAQAFALGDLNGDGRVDILAGWYDTGYSIWWNQGNGTFAP